VHLRSLLTPVIAVLALCAIACPPAEAAEGKDSLRLLWASSTDNDLVTVVYGDYIASKEHNWLFGANYGHHLSDTMFGLPFELTGNVGVQWLDERGYQGDGLGLTAFIKAYYNWELPLTEKSIRLGLGEGLSYVTQIPMSEKRDFATEDAKSARLMNYLEWTIDLPLRQFQPMDNLLRGRLEELSVGFIVWHRSSVFGVFSETGGGVNFMGFGFEARY
jgi:outer membrane protein